MRYALGIASDGEWVAATADDSGGLRRIALRGETTDSVGDIARTLAAQIVAQFGDADAVAFAHRDALSDEELDGLRHRLDDGGLTDCALVSASVALTFDRDLAVGAAMWAWQNRKGRAGTLPGNAAAGAGGAAAGGLLGAASRAPDADLPGGPTMADFGAGRSMADFDAGPTRMADFGQGESMDDFGAGRTAGEFGAPEQPPPAAPATPSRPRGKLVAAAAAAVVVVAAAGTAVALTSGSGDDTGLSAGDSATTIEATTTVVDPATLTLWDGKIGFRDPLAEDGAMEVEWSLRPENRGQFGFHQQTIQVASWILEIGYDVTTGDDRCQVRRQANAELNGEGSVELIYLAAGSSSDGFVGWRVQGSSGPESTRQFTETETRTCDGVQEPPQEVVQVIQPDFLLEIPGEAPQLSRLDLDGVVDESFAVTHLGFAQSTQRTYDGVLNRQCGEDRSAPCPTEGTDTPTG